MLYTVYGIIQHVTFWYQLFSFSIILWRFIQAVVLHLRCSPLYHEVVLYSMDRLVCLTTHLLDFWVVPGLWLTQVKLLWTCVYRFCVDITFDYPRKNVNKCDSWVIQEWHVSFCKKLPYAFPEWLYHLTFPPPMYEWFLCSAFEMILCDCQNQSPFNSFH